MAEQDALTLWRMLGCPKLGNSCGAPSDYRTRDGEPLCCTLDKGHEGKHRAGPLAWGDPEQEARERWASYVQEVSEQELRRWTALKAEEQQAEREAQERSLLDHRRGFLSGDEPR